LSGLLIAEIRMANFYRRTLPDLPDLPDLAVFERQPDDAEGDMRRGTYVIRGSFILHSLA
jgi:hypothetical protein